MAEIKPFKGILYNQKKVNIEQVITPPYDVISHKMQNRFYARGPHNIIRLILGKAEKKDTKKFNKYTRARKFLKLWLRNKTLLKDRKPSIYIYTQEYLHKGQKKMRIGFIALMKLEDPKESGVLPHEYTLGKPKEDRLRLIRETKSNLSPIFSLFQDTPNEINRILKSFIKKTGPLFLLENDGIVHRIWRITDRKAVKKLRSLMRNKKIFIADGHHRYEVALSYRNEMRKKRAFRKNMDYVMMYFSNLSERSSLTILSTHRVVRNIKGFNEKKAKHRLKKYFLIEKMENLEKLFDVIDKETKGRVKKHIFGLYAGKNGFYLLTLKDPGPLKRLDVAILHELILNRILDMKHTENSIKYVRNEKDAVTLVDNGDYEAAFFLQPTDVMEMKRVAEKGEMMPQKSTYFYPKLLTGLVINKF